MHCRSGSRSWTLCSCPWKWCRPSQNASCKIFNHLNNSFGIIKNLIPYSYGSDHAVLIRYIWKESIPVPRLFIDKVKLSAARSSTIQISFYSVPPLNITLWYLEDIVPLPYLLWILVGVILLTVLAIPRVLGCLSTENTDKWIEATLWLVTPSNLMLGNLNSIMTFLA